MLIYILTNPLFPGMCKVGFTNDLEAKLKRLNRSEIIPEPFEVYATYETSSSMSEKGFRETLSVMGAFHPVAPFDGKTTAEPFFEDEPESILAVLSTIASFSGTLDKLHCVEKPKEVKPATRERRPNWGLFAYGLRAGDRLDYIGPGSQDKMMSVRVIDDRYVSDGEEIGSLTHFGKKFSNGSSTCTQLFTFDGKTLWDIRQEMEKLAEDDELPFN